MTAILNKINAEIRKTKAFRDRSSCQILKNLSNDLLKKLNELKQQNNAGKFSDVIEYTEQYCISCADIDKQIYEITYKNWVESTVLVKGLNYWSSDSSWQESILRFPKNKIDQSRYTVDADGIYHPIGFKLLQNGNKFEELTN
jgi:hypothetical protein